MINLIAGGFALGAAMLLPLGIEPVETEPDSPDDFSVFSILPPDQQEILAKCNIDSPELERLLRLSEDKFDQDMQGGWRLIARDENCLEAAAITIKAYINYSHPRAPENIRILRWHSGQLLAGTDKTEDAVAFFRGTYSDDVEWNLYVDGTIAFLQSDKQALKAARDTLAARPVSEEEKEARRQFLSDNPNITMPDGFVDEPQNLSVLDRLLACFGRDYNQAYGKCESDTQP